MTMVVMVLGNVLETVVMTFIIFLYEDDFGDGGSDDDDFHHHNHPHQCCRPSDHQK